MFDADLAYDSRGRLSNAPDWTSFAPMALYAVLLVLLSAVMHAIWNALARRTDDPYAFFVTFNALASVIWLPIAILAGWNESLSVSDTALIAGSGSLQVLYFVLLSGAYRRGGLSLVYPIARGTGVALVPVGGLLLYAERPSGAGWLGIAATLAGLAFLAMENARSRQATPSDVDPVAIIFAFSTGLVISTYSLVDNYGVGRVDPIVYGYGLILASTVIQFPYVASRRRVEVRRQILYNWRSVIAGAVLSLGTYMLVLVAMTGANVGYVVPLRETSIVFALILGIIVLREPVGPRRILAALVIATGAACIAIGG